MPSQLAESVKYLMSLKTIRIKAILKELNEIMEANLNKKAGENNFICYTYWIKNEIVGASSTNVYDESLYGRTKSGVKFRGSLMGGYGWEEWDPADKDIIVGNIPIKAYLGVWLADYDALIEECDKRG